MKVKPVDKEFRAIVIFRIRGDTKNAKGFRYPPVVPGTYEAAVAVIQKHVRAIDGFIRADQNEKAHAAADRALSAGAIAGDIAPDDNRRACANDHCGDVHPRRSMRQGRCPACAAFRRRTGKERPSRLVEAHRTATGWW